MAIAHAARLRVAVCPAETVGALLVTRQQLLAGIGLALVGIVGGEVAPAQFERVDLRCAGEFIHGAFQRYHPGGSAGRAHVQRGVHIQWGQAIAERNVVTLVEHAAPFHQMLGEVLEAGCLAKCIVGNRQQPAVRVCAQAQPLFGAGPVAEGEHLLARQRDAHRALQVQCRHHCQRQLVLRAQARAEGATDKCRTHLMSAFGRPNTLCR